MVHVLHLLDVRPRTLEEARIEVERYDELDHPALPGIVEMFEYKRQLAVVLERDDGVRLDKLKGYLDRDRERLPDAAIWFVGWRLCSALAQAHLARDQEGKLAPILHGTLSLRDVLVEWDGDVKLHGLCPLLSAAPISEGDEVAPPSRAWVGPGFRNDEPLTPRADTYAAALVLRCLLTGRPPPTPGASLESMAELRPDIPGDVARSLDRALHGRARPSAAELAQRLEGLVRVTDGRRALLDCMELYQALWGLWSVASPQVWSVETPSAGLVLDPESAALSSLSPSERRDDHEIADELTLGDLDDVEPTSPYTSRSPGAQSTMPDTVDEAPVAVTSAPPQLPDKDDGEAGEARGPISLTSTMASAPHEPAPPGPKSSPPVDPVAASGPDEPAPPSASRSRPGRPPAPPTSSVEPAAPLPRPPRTPLTSTAEPAPDEERSRWPLYLVAACLVALVAWYATRDRGADPEAPSSASSATARADVPMPPNRAASAPPPTEMSAATSPPPRPETASSEDELPAEVPPEVVVQPTLTPDERADMEWSQGYLLVESEIRGALVYVNGHRVGPVGRKNKIFCGRKFVRLGTENPPTTPWLTGGTTVELACRDLTVVSIAGPE